MSSGADTDQSDLGTDTNPVTNPDPSSGNAAVTETDPPPMPPEPAVYVKIIYKNLIEDDREDCAGSFPLSDIYDKDLQLVRRGTYPTIHHRLLAIAADQLSEILPSKSYSAADRTAFSTHDTALRCSVAYGKNNRMGLTFRGCDTQLYRFLSKLKLNTNVDVVFTIFHPGLDAPLRYHGPATPPSLPSTPAPVPSPVIPPNTTSMETGGNAMNDEPQSDTVDQNATDESSDADPTNGQAQNQPPEQPAAPAANNTQAHDTPFRPTRFANADASEAGFGPRGRIGPTRSFGSSPHSGTTDDSDATDYTPVPNDMVAKVYPNGSIQSDPTSAYGTPAHARSYTIYVPRTLSEMPPCYNSFDFVPEQKKYILSSFFRAENVSKWKLPTFTSEDTALNWYQTITVYAMGLGIFVPPYGSLEQGNPMGSLWYLVSREVPFALDMEASWSNALFHSSFGRYQWGHVDDVLRSPEPVRTAWYTNAEQW
jgi:hypothetical protein